MSDELRDEVEAINSIYGEGCLAASNETTYILTPPGDSTSFLVEFPLDYPAVPPVVVGTNSIGQGAKKGDAARKLALFCQALGNVYEPGSVCLFDAIEDFNRLLEEQASEEPEEHVPETGNHVDTENAASVDDELVLSKEPSWILSDPVVELKSTFVARCARVQSTAEAEAFVKHLMASDKRVRTATHNMTAWRIRGPNNTSFQDCDDDGETAAGGRLLHLMQLMDLWDVMVVVTRWYGGHKLGPRRFALINQAARDSFVKAGLVATETKKR